MTREILFRGFHENENSSTTITVAGKDVQGEWVYGYYVKFRMNKDKPVAHYIQPVKEDERLGIVQEVIFSTVGQYTGLDDKNGERIFEGDKCLVTRTCIMVYGYIKFKNGSFYLQKECDETFINLSDLEFNGFKIKVGCTIFDS